MAQGFLDNWLICGPFYSGPGWATLDEDYLFGEDHTHPRAGQFTFGKKWMPYDASDHVLELLAAPFALKLFVTAYAHTYVHVPTGGEALLLCGSDDGIKIWLNGENVWRNDVNRGAKAGSDRVNVTLKAGWNSLMCKVRQGWAQWQLIVQLVQPDGSEIAGLTCAHEGDYPVPALPETAAGIRPRFVTETYEMSQDGLCRLTEFEVGNIGTKPLQDVELDAGQTISAGSLDPGHSVTVNAKLTLEQVKRVMGLKVAAHSGGKELPARVIVSEGSWLLRNFFAPIFVPRAFASLPVPKLGGFTGSPFAEDETGTYTLVDPEGLRHYLAGLVGRFPMNGAPAEEASSSCDDMLRFAMADNADSLQRVLGSAKLPPLEVTG